MDLNFKRFVLDKNVRLAVIVLFTALLVIAAYFTYSAFSLKTEGERNVTICSYEHRGDFNFLVHLKPNSLYDTATLGPGEKLYFNIITDRVDTSLTYNFKIDRPAKVNSQVEVVAELLSDKWRKTYVLNKTSFNSNEFTINLPFNANFYLDEADRIGKEIGVYSAKTDLKIIYNIRTTAKTDLKEIDEVFTPVVSIALTKIDFNITGSQYSKAGAIERKEVFVKNDVVEKRNYLLAATSLAFILLLSFTLLTEGKVEEDNLAKSEKKYGDWIVNAAQLPEGMKSVPLVSFDDLVKVAGELGKPIIHKVDGHSYFVFDGPFRYEYIHGVDEVRYAETSEVVEFTVPERVLQGESAELILKFLNKGSRPLIATGCVEIREQAGKVIEHINSEEALVKPGEILDIPVVWSAKDYKVGGYWAIAWVKYDSTATCKTDPKRLRIIERVEGK